jgi:DNA (cytosine-5)-methyltransferase 1
MSSKMPSNNLAPSISPQSESPNSYALLTQLRKRLSPKQIATALGIHPKTVVRWETHQSSMPLFVMPALERLLPPPQPASTSSGEFSFIDLFAGIGGMRLGFEQSGGKCVFTSEWNTHSQNTYKANFDVSHEIVGDIVPQPAEEIPDHDVLLAGFPCQPFSIAGVSKKNSLGRSHGFSDATQGTLFFDVARIIAAKRPKAFLLENVKNLVSHDRGRTFRVILDTLREELGYHVEYRVLDGGLYTPQHRERIMIVGFREKTNFSWNHLNFPEEKPTLRSILHPENGSELPEKDYTLGEKAEVNHKYILSDKLWQYLQNYAKKHKEKGNGFGFGLVTPDQTTRTLSARYYKDGSEILVARESGNPRRLTSRVCSFDGISRNIQDSSIRYPSL